ncbi:MAG: Ni/Fe-hydrogenase cytochrome b subunit [Candidatus Marinimicrobia bacterium]|nr:Ni/Fe-hydrogenase cytochrome b subunit [Candidatus Neomarinimicrobiota bacterium]
MSENKPLGGKIITKPFIILAILAGIAGVLLIKRFIFGLGAVTNLSDGYPWGIWIVYDVLIGTAIGCGGYVMAILVYVFNKGKYHPLVRPAVLTSVFGYTMAGFSILIDVGRYWQLYNIFLPWHVNLNSIMFEVAFCVATYVLVLWIEISPAFLEKFNKTKALGFMNKILFIFIAIGVLLPTMHQSTLGSLMIIAGSKLSALWQTGWLPLLFLISSILMGYAIVVFESLYSSAGFKRPFETPVLAKISKLMAWLVVVYLAFRFGDLIWRGELGLIFTAGWVNSIMFIIENLLFIIPMVILFSEKNRQSTKSLFLAAIALVLAGAVYRFNAFLVGFDPGVGWHYWPSASELLISIGIVAFEIMAYLAFVKWLPVLPNIKHSKS